MTLDTISEEPEENRSKVEIGVGKKRDEKIVETRSFDGPVKYVRVCCRDCQTVRLSVCLSVCLSVGQTHQFTST